MAATFLLGILLEVLSGLAGVVGKQLIGLSARTRNLSRAKCTFAVGMFMTTILGAVLDAVAYGFAAQSVIAPLNGLEISLNIMTAPCVLKETVTLRHVIGTLLVAGGAALTAAYGPHGSTPASLDELHAVLFRWEVGVYITIFASGLVVCAVNVRTREVGDKVRGLALGVMAGGIAGNMWFVKCAVGLLRLGFEGDWSAWSTWLPYVLLSCAAGVAIGNVPLMVMGLQEFEAIFMVTLFGGSSIVVACVSGNVVLDEGRGQLLFDRVAYWMSILVMVSGLCVINTTTVHGIAISDSEPLAQEEDDDGRRRRRKQTCFAPDELLPSGDSDDEDPDIDIEKTWTLARTRRQRAATVLWVNPATLFATVSVPPSRMERSKTISIGAPYEALPGDAPRSKFSTM